MAKALGVIQYLAKICGVDKHSRNSRHNGFDPASYNVTLNMLEPMEEADCPPEHRQLRFVTLIEGSLDEILRTEVARKKVCVL